MYKTVSFEAFCFIIASFPLMTNKSERYMYHSAGYMMDTEY